MTSLVHLPYTQVEMIPTERSLRTWTLSVGSVSLLSLVVELTDVGAKAKFFHHLRGRPGSGPFFWEFDLRVRPPVECHSTLGQVPSLLLGASTEDAGALDPFLQEALELTLHWMGTRVEKRRLPNAQVKDSFLKIQAHLRERLLPDAHAAAARYPAGERDPLRWEIYRSAAEDVSGRIAQMASACPGLLLFAEASRRESEHARRELLSAIVSGQRLPKLLDMALDLRSDADAGGADLRHGRRLWIKRASPAVSLDCLRFLPTWPVTAEDIPRDEAENVRWYTFMLIAARAGQRIQAQAQRHAFLAFASRHAGELSRRLAAVDADLLQAANWLVDYVNGSGRHPGPASIPAVLIDESFDWHNQVAARGFVETRFRFPAHRELDPGPTRGFPDWECRMGDGLPASQKGEIRFLATVGELNLESERMGHCVASHAGAAISGGAQIFHAEIAGEQATIEITCADGSAAISEAKGIRNQPVSDRAWCVIQRWLADLQAFLRMPGQGRGTDGFPPGISECLQYQVSSKG